MSHSRQRGSTKPHPLLAVLATFLVVGGVAVVAYLAQQSKKSMTPVEVNQEVSPPALPKAEQKALPALLFVNDSAVTAVKSNGYYERMTPEAFALAYPDQARWPKFGADAGTGAIRPFAFGAETQSPSTGFRSPDGNFLAKISPSRTDGATMIELQRGKEAVRSLVLRTKDGKPIKDGQLFGWFQSEAASEQAMMLTGMVTGTRVVLAVHTDGAFQELGAIPDGVVAIVSAFGSLYALTGNQDQGIETQPRGPSQVFKFNLEGSAPQAVLRSEDFILALLPDPFRARYAYIADSGKAFVVEGESRIELGKLRPLLFLPSGELVVRVGYDLEIRNVGTGTSTKVGALPEGGVTVYSVHP